ncbi:hypothetical protein HDZ31DRAFT_62849 [Schizophyllum fasciatum]
MHRSPALPPRLVPRRSSDASAPRRSSDASAPRRASNASPPPPPPRMQGGYVAEMPPDVHYGGAYEYHHGGQGRYYDEERHLHYHPQYRVSQPPPWNPIA